MESRGPSPFRSAHLRSLQVDDRIFSPVGQPPQGPGGITIVAVGWRRDGPLPCSTGACGLVLPGRVMLPLLRKDLVNGRGHHSLNLLDTVLTEFRLCSNLEYRLSVRTSPRLQLWGRSDRPTPSQSFNLPVRFAVVSAILPLE